MSIWLLDLQSMASLATAAGVLLAAWQLRLAARQAVTSFEDSLSREYRTLTHRLPSKALLGQELTPAETAAALDDFYRYFDLSNEQVFLRANGRVSKATWRNWAEGIQSMLGRPAFAVAWAEVKERAPDSFEELRWLESSHFTGDPRFPNRRGKHAMRALGLTTGGKKAPVPA